MVELGVYDGKNLIYLARNNLNVSFYGVDLWTHFDSEKIVKSPEKSQDEWDKKYMNLIRRSSKFKNVKLIKGISWESSDHFDDESLDLVFIDANHNYSSVKKDIDSWLPKIKRIGWISGHDFSLHFPGVIKAVLEKFNWDELNILGDSVWAFKVKK